MSEEYFRVENCKCQDNRVIILSMSGHSKWATIKRQKGITDAKKGQLFTKLSNAITIAVKSGGGVGDPDKNFKLRLIVDNAKAVNMPKDSINRAIEKAAGAGGGEVDELVYEGFAPGGVAIIVETVTDNKQRTVAVVKSMFDKYGGNLGAMGSVSYLFVKKGEIIVRKNDKDFEQLLSLGLEAGAEDVVDDQEVAFFYTDVIKMQKVKQFLEEANISIESAEIGYFPILGITVDEQTNTRVDNLVEKLTELDDVQRVYTNLA